MKKNRISRNCNRLPLVPLVLCPALCFLPAQLHAGGIVSETSESALRAAVAGGGLVTFACDGTWVLSGPITPTNDLTIDGRGHSVILSGGYTSSVLKITNVTRTTLANLTIQNCRGIWGGAIYNSNGILNLLSVGFIANTASNSYWSPPNALAEGGNGGAIYSQGTVNATNCLFSGNSAHQREAVDQIPTGIPDSFYVPTPAYGGAIYNSGQLNLEGCAFEGNSAFAAPGHQLEMNGSPVMVTSGREAGGGAVMSAGFVSLNRCRFINNLAQAGWSPTAPFSPSQTPYPGVSGSSGTGGAVSADQASIFGCSFLSNTVVAGGGGSGGSAYYATGGSGGPGGPAFGGAVKASSGSIANSILAWNIAYGGGGGGVILVHAGTGGGPGGSGGPSQGGAIHSAGGGLTVVNSTITSNYTYGGEGGYGGSGALAAPSGPGGAGGTGNAQCFSSTDALTNCTMTFNFTIGGRGGSGSTGGSSGIVTGGLVAGSKTVNCILATNTPANWFGSVADLGCNLSTDAGGFTNTTSRTSIDPRLSVLAMNGGPTLSMALVPGSPGIDAAAAGSAPSIDQRGYPRPAGLAADIGAFEYGSMLPRLSVRKLGSSAVVVTAQGNTNQPCRFFSSSNLGSWTHFATNRFGGDGFAQFTNANAFTSPLMWYRVSTP